ncbi:hypothetical protein H5410_016983 [Solanum commersonii]|uniref:Uncharacterized protein n=1 Tax=Solanum commersonii TaxID=4109 RepID=A0A9J5ZZ82_SOLCO|nr:hypothetical protein H5410_016983 [Solanum commersonii]
MDEHQPGKLYSLELLGIEMEQCYGYLTYMHKIFVLMDLQIPVFQETLACIRSKFKLAMQYYLNIAIKLPLQSNHKFDNLGSATTHIRHISFHNTHRQPGALKFSPCTGYPAYREQAHAKSS